MNKLTKKVLAEIEKGNLQTWPQVLEFATEHFTGGGITPWEARAGARAFVAHFQAQGHTL